MSKPPCQMHVRRGGVDLRVCANTFIHSCPFQTKYGIMHEDQHPCIVRGILLNANYIIIK